MAEGSSTKGGDLEQLKGLVDFEIFRPALREAVRRSDSGKGGRLPFDHVLMFKVLVPQSVRKAIAIVSEPLSQWMA